MKRALVLSLVVALVAAGAASAGGYAGFTRAQAIVQARHSALVIVQIYEPEKFKTVRAFIYSHAPTKVVRVVCSNGEKAWAVSWKISKSPIFVSRRKPVIVGCK